MILPRPAAFQGWTHGSEPSSRRSLFASELLCAHQLQIVDREALEEIEGYVAKFAAGKEAKHELSR